MNRASELHSDKGHFLSLICVYPLFNRPCITRPQKGWREDGTTSRWKDQSTAHCLSHCRLPQWKEVRNGNPERGEL